MPLIDPAEFERGRLLAAGEWRRRGQPVAAEAFLALGLERCGFGMDRRSRTCWARVDGMRIGLRFAIETGEYEGSFIYRPGPSRAAAADV